MEIEIMCEPRIKTDITAYSTGRIILSPRAVRALGAKVGDALILVRSGIEYLLCARRMRDGFERNGLLRSTCNSGASLQAQNVSLAKMILGGDKVGKYRSGETIEIGGEKYITIITRKNYANK